MPPEHSTGICRSALAQRSTASFTCSTGMLSSRTASAPWASASSNSARVRTSTSIGCDPRRLRCARSSSRRDAPRQRNVIVLDQHSVGKIQAMVLTAAAAHCVLVEHPQAGRGLAGVEDACPGPGNRIHKLASQGGDAAQPLQKVQNHALAGKNHARVVPHHRNGLAVVQAYAIENFRMAGDFVMRSYGSIEQRHKHPECAARSPLPREYNPVSR